MKIGAQFYTVHKHCKTLDDFAESLKKVADIGYTTVQISGVCEYEPEWLAEQLKKNGLQCVLTHKSIGTLTGDAEKLVREHSVYGCDCIGLGSHKFTFENIPEEVKAFRDLVTPFAKVFRDNGKYFMYHNHEAEFIKHDNVTILEMMAQAMPSDLMGFTLDTYWVQVGGGDPAWWLERLSGRVPCIHLKDCGYKQRMEVVGEGNINFATVFKAAEKAGTQYMLVEQDNCNGEDPFLCLKRSYDNLRAWGFR